MQAALGVSAGVAFVVSVCCFPLYSYIGRRVEERYVLSPADRQSKGDQETMTKAVVIESKEIDSKEVVVEPAKQSKKQKVMKALFYSLNADVHSSITDSQTVAAIHNNAEKFDPKTQMVFEYIQIFTAIVDSFAHGANGTDCSLILHSGGMHT